MTFARYNQFPNHTLSSSHMHRAANQRVSGTLAFKATIKPFRALIVTNTKICARNKSTDMIRTNHHFC